MKGVSIIFASTIDLIIGKDYGLPWKSTKDLKHFKRTTTDGVVIMGRKTYESIGGALKNRVNIILSKTSEWLETPNSHVATSLEEAINIAKTYDKEIFIIGGSQIYEQSFPIADRVIATWVFPNNGQTIVGDTHLRGFEPNDWLSVDTSYEVDVDLILKFETYERTHGNS